MEDVQHAISIGALCRECLDDIEDPEGRSRLCANCTHSLNQEEKQARKEDLYGDKDTEDF